MKKMTCSQGTCRERRAVRISQMLLLAQPVLAITWATIAEGGDQQAEDRAFRAPVAEALRAQTETAVERICGENPLPKAEWERLSAFLKQVDLTVPEHEREYKEVFEKHGAALLPIIEEHLRAPETELRRTALDAITPFLRVPPGKDHLDEDTKELAILLLTRSMDDRCADNRIRALGKAAGLSRLLSQVQKDQLADAMVLALVDPERAVQDAAGFYLIEIGYRDRVPAVIAQRVSRKSG